MNELLMLITVHGMITIRVQLKFHRKARAAVGFFFVLQVNTFISRIFPKSSEISQDNFVGW